MNLPELLNVHALIGDSPVEGLIVEVCIKVNLKNDFSSLHGLTDAGGSLSVKKDTLLERALTEKKFFLMDYADPEANFTGVIELTPCSDLMLERALNAYSQFKSVYNYPVGYHEMLKRGIGFLESIDVYKVALKCVVDEKHVQVKQGRVE